MENEVIESKHERVIYLHGDFEPEYIKTVIAKIIDINVSDDLEEKRVVDYQRKPISLYISSHGGLVVEAFNLISAIRASKTPIHGYVNGYAYSAGFWTFISCHKRFIGKYADIMYHQLSGGMYYSTLDKMKFNLEESQNYMKRLHGIVKEFTNITQEQMNEYDQRSRDWFIDAETAIKLKCADQII